MTATFTPTDTTDYASDGIVTNLITVTPANNPIKINPILTWNPIGNIPYGTPLTIPTATDQNNNPIAGSFAYVDQNNNPVSQSQVLPVDTYTGTAIFTPDDTTNYVSGGNSYEFVHGNTDTGNSYNSMK